MKLSSLLLGISTLGQTVLSHPLDLPFKHSHNDFHTLDRRQGGVIATTGAAGSVQPRLEIRQMKSQQPNQFTLLMLALQQWQGKSQTDATSYFQIAGIHGVPRADWNGVGQCSTCTGADGYAVHDSVSFPAWHRAYLALFEQEFVNNCKAIASSWTGSNKAQMQAAANVIRWPYWDWAAAPPTGPNNMPAMLTSTSISIGGPNGQQTIDNPLYQFNFQDPSKMRYTPFNKWTSTLRYPTSIAADASSNEGAAISAFNNIRASLQDQVYQLFTTCKDFLHFSNDQAGASTTSCKNSLEALHNTIHTSAGGRPSTAVKSGGHMYYLATSSFDPLFWLHHSNVDRIFAMWQTINSASYGASQAAAHSSWTVAQGSTQDLNSPLAPFYKDSSGGSFWTTADVKDWKVFKYTYPEFVNSDGSSAAISNYIKKLYGPNASAKAGSSKRSLQYTSSASSVSAAPSASSYSSVASASSYSSVASASSYPAAPSSSSFPQFPGSSYNGSGPGFFGGGSPFGLPSDLIPSLTAENGSTYEYVCNIETPRYALDGSYEVYIFLGNPESDDPASWISDSNLVGPMGVLSQPEMKGVDVITSGSVPLTRVLTEKLGSGILNALSPEFVSPFLEQMITWKIVGPDGSSVDPSELEGFDVSVYASTSTEGGDGSLPTWSDFIPMPRVTKGKAGGGLSHYFPSPCSS